jgi:hypothetical protein
MTRCGLRRSHLADTGAVSSMTCEAFGLACVLPIISRSSQKSMTGATTCEQCHWPQRFWSLVEQSAQAVAAIYLRNVFPDMKVTWGSHPNNTGHNDSPGCFRCHDGSHTSSEGETITNDCNACHSLLAVDEQNPKVLADLGLK